MNIILLLALAIHTIAFVIGWGYYGILGRIVIPGLDRSLAVRDQAKALVAVERQAVPLVLLSVVLFLVSGTYLLDVDSSYTGLGQFDSDWARVMLLKHAVVIALIAVGVAIDYLIRTLDLDADADEHDIRRDIRLIRVAAEGATGLGALIVVLTAAAQLGG